MNRIALIATGLALSTPAVAGTIWGGEIVDKTALHVAAGFPHVDVGVRVSLADIFELTPRVRFFYFQGLGLAVGVEVFADARIQLLDADKLHGSLTLGLGVPISFTGGAAVGVGLFHPGWIMDYGISEDIALDFGFRFEDNLYFVGGAAVFSGALPFIVGVEGEVADKVRVGGKVEAGPAFAAFGGFTGVGAVVRALVGVDIAL